jgi:purine-nucleoside phosphorylase
VSIHISAQPGEVAPRILLPGDPRRAKWIAETFLDDATLYSQVRGMLGYTGTYRGQPLSVQGTGMGQPSLGIYAHELFTDYGVTHAIRVGTCGSLQPDVGVRDVIIAMSASTDSAMNARRLPGVSFAPCADWSLLSAAVAAAQGSNSRFHVGGIFSADTFYAEDDLVMRALAAHGSLAAEMETALLYTLAAKQGAKALSVCTVSDEIFGSGMTTSQEREQSFEVAVHIALDAITVVDG